MTCIQPVIRALQFAREESGQYQDGVDAVGFTLVRTAEVNSKRPVQPPTEFIRYEGTNTSFGGNGQAWPT
jgi:hypothetical protein